MSDNLQRMRDAYYGRMAQRGLTPLWTVMTEAVPSEPVANCEPVFWDFAADIRPALFEAGELISAEEAQRRVLMLNNPALQRGTTKTLLCAIQMIKEGEIAPAHRHTQSALRFVIEGGGAYTAINGEKTSMNPGDLILTPAWFWHDHGKDSKGPMIWLDGLDIPLVNHLGATFSEEFDERRYPEARPAEDSRARYGSGLLPLEPVVSTSHSPVFRYPYDTTRQALEALRRTNEWDPCHGLKLRYSNPLSGEFVLPTIAAFIQLLPRGFSGAPYRSTESTIVMAVEGRGRAHVGNRTFSFGPHDIFVIPNWTWTTLEADVDAVLFSYSDRAALEKLALLRQQRSNEARSGM
ncbi:gentisate 1,2-dioxygenase [Bradyrhizobium sp. Ai1a-2]|uniref:gentisate 1,2-dioxygenase n=1 Tax=Bradyrhizobium sp. Ai1a-2 TaxID=196490 RepID=UPI000422BDA1|nr:gentisate 1,2-dioxygenase [Bradyrhizobium sp. Ai1a-2]